MAAATPPSFCARRHSRQPFPSGARGSLLIVAMIISAIIGISLVSYIKLAGNSLTLADRSFYQPAALNLAEMGIEEAMYCFNRLDDVATPEAAWTVSGRTWTHSPGDTSITTKISDITLGPGVTGEVRVYCSNYNPGNAKPFVVAKATVTFARGNKPIEKWLQVALRRRSLWANGMVARNSIVWSGGVTQADSWNSDHDNNPATPGVAYGSTDGPARPNATVGSPNNANNAVSVSGGQVRGRILTGGGSVGHTSTAILEDNLTQSNWETALVSSDFSATFPSVTVPSPPAIDKNAVNSSSPITFPSTLPAAGHKAWNGTYYYDFSSDWVLRMSGTQALTINGPVAFLATAHSGKTAVDLSGNAQITIDSTGSLTVYTDGDIDATGNAFANATSTPIALQLFGTNPAVSGQTFRLAGGGAAIGAIYAPNATVELKGGAELHGAAVGNRIEVTGTSKFHYDEALGNVSTGNPFGVEQWRELQSADERAEFAARLNF